MVAFYIDDATNCEAPRGDLTSENKSAWRVLKLQAFLVDDTRSLGRRNEEFEDSGNGYGYGPQVDQMLIPLSMNSPVLAIKGWLHPYR